MSRILKGTTAALLALSLTACGGGGSEDESASTPKKKGTHTYATTSGLWALSELPDGSIIVNNFGSNGFIYNERRSETGDYSVNDFHLYDNRSNDKEVTYIGNIKLDDTGFSSKAEFEVVNGFGSNTFLSLRMGKASSHRRVPKCQCYS
ncbi:hypothetical protein [Thaumasiovibrio subtropicus]|uniref:hypothetical protein n=1 Tax=Thaumasiovibrio subtropicus TaxID=1891207 RepID=UPI000B34EE81|nr:hypothetical protein [Thaumasiovibrio subtropicus]